MVSSILGGIIVLVGVQFSNTDTDQKSGKIERHEPSSMRSSFNDIDSSPKTYIVPEGINFESIKSYCARSGSYYQ